MALVDLNTVRKSVVSELQASLVSFGSSTTGNAPDGSNYQYRSSTEIDTAILLADMEVCVLICNTLLHPFQSTFAVFTSALSNGSRIPARQGMILSVSGTGGSVTSTTFAAAAISVSTDLVTSTSHGLVTGQMVQLTTSGTLPAGLSLSTNYYIYVATASTYGFCTSIYNAKAGILIDITGQGSGTHTVTSQYVDLTPADSKDTIVQANSSPYLFAQSAGINAGFYFIEGDLLYTTSSSVQMTVTDFTETSTPQAPEPYTQAVISGAIAKLYKDGSDSEQLNYHRKFYEEALQLIGSMAKVLPEIQAYRMAA